MPPCVFVTRHLLTPPPSLPGREVVGKTLVEHWPDMLRAGGRLGHARRDRRADTSDTAGLQVQGVESPEKEVIRMCSSLIDLVSLYTSSQTQSYVQYHVVGRSKANGLGKLMCFGSLRSHGMGNHFHPPDRSSFFWKGQLPPCLLKLYFEFDSFNHVYT